MAEHERKTQKYNLRTGQERLHLSVDQPKQQTVCVCVCERTEGGKTHHEGHSDTKWMLHTFNKDTWPC